MLKGKLMQIFQDIRRADILIVVFDFDEMSAINRKSTDSQRLQTVIMKAVLEYGFGYAKGELYCKERIKL